MAMLNDQRGGWDEVELPCVVRYRRNAFSGPLLICGLLILTALTCTYWSGQWFAGVPFIVLAAATLVLTLEPLRHVRSIDCVLIDRHALTLHRVDGSEQRIEFVAGGEFLVRHGYFHRTIIYATAAKDYRDAQHVMVDMLDLPRGHDIYGLCRLLNELGSGDTRPAGAQHHAAGHADDWYREPPRLSRTMFAAGCLGLALLLAFRRQAHGAVPAHEQRHAQLLLQEGDVLADRARRHVELGGGEAEAGMARGGLEGAKRIERGKLVEPADHGGPHRGGAPAKCPYRRARARRRRARISAPGRRDCVPSFPGSRTAATDRPGRSRSAH